MTTATSRIPARSEAPTRPSWREATGATAGIFAATWWFGVSLAAYARGVFRSPMQHATTAALVLLTLLLLARCGVPVDGGHTARASAYDDATSAALVQASCASLYPSSVAKTVAGRWGCYDRDTGALLTPVYGDVPGDFPGGAASPALGATAADPSPAVADPSLAAADPSLAAADPSLAAADLSLVAAAAVPSLATAATGPPAPGNPAGPTSRADPALGSIRSTAGIRAAMGVGTGPAWAQDLVGRYASLVEAAAARYGVDAAFIYAVMRAEGGGAGIVSSAGARGLMQIMPATARSVKLAAAAYNGGPGAARRCGETGCPGENARYVRRVSCLYERRDDPAATSACMGL
jgi:hypothetical protein